METNKAGNYRPYLFIAGFLISGKATTTGAGLLNGNFA